MPVNCSVYVKYAKKIRPTLRMLNLSTYCVYAQGVLCSWSRLNCSLPRAAVAAAAAHTVLFSISSQLLSCAFPHCVCAMRLQEMTHTQRCTQRGSPGKLANAPLKHPRLVSSANLLPLPPPIHSLSPTVQRCAKCALTSKKNKKRSIKTMRKTA